MQIDKVNDNLYNIKDLFSRSQAEHQMKEAIYEIKSWLDNTEFNFFVHKIESGEINLIREWKDLTSKISDNISLLSSLKESKYYDNFADEIKVYDEKMIKLD